MIETLRIDEIKIVEKAELEFGPGLNVLTGETGAGKSIILGALEMLAGARGSADIPRKGSDVGTVEAVFRTEGLASFEVELEARGFRDATEADEHELVVHRTLNASGRSRARIAGQLVPIATLADVFSDRIEISSQHSSQALLRPESHGRYLDAAGDLLGLRGEVEAAVARLREIDAELVALRAEEEERVRRRDFLAFQLEEIDAVSPTPEEFCELGIEHSRLAHAGQMREDGAALAFALEGDSSGGAGCAIDSVASAVRLGEGLEKLDPALAETVERLRGILVELREVARDFERHSDGIESDPARLAALEDRLAQVEKLRRKYGQSVEEILAFREEAAAQLSSIEGASDREGLLETERGEVEAALVRKAKRLSKGRTAAAKALTGEVQRSLAALDMPAAVFQVDLAPAPVAPGLPCGSAGNEAPEFKFSGNAKEAPAPLQKVASGGELSRVFLALKNALRREGRGMVLVFDEVDAGIGGRAAGRVGQVLAELASHHQVLCITHLPQIAAFADAHFRVEKGEKAGRVCATVERLSEPERVDEIARMAGGEQITAATRKHARELLKRKTLS
ncbi:MAG: DNA repair protein RecN [bacterium]|nr:DNA repair protein RecN [bacterium]